MYLQALLQEVMDHGIGSTSKMRHLKSYLKVSPRSVKRDTLTPLKDGSGSIKEGRVSKSNSSSGKETEV